MREVLYRGKRVDNDEWVYGYYYKISAPPVCFKEDEKVVRDKHFIIFEHPNYVPDWGMPRQMVQAEVDPKTIGQWTGLTDETGIKIFEGDVIKVEETGYVPFTRTGIVVFKEGRFGVEYKTCYGENAFCVFDKTSVWREGNASGELTYKYCIVGNVWDNPELFPV